jgi:molybdate transport system substrate-binding protein
MSKRLFLLSLLVFFGVCLLFIARLADKEEKLIIYSGKGLKKPMEEIRAAFREKHDIELDIIYAGSKTCLGTIQETKRGDIFVPGSVDAINDAGDLVVSHQYIALHVPIVCVHKDNPKGIHEFDDLARPGVRLTIGNADMCSIGAVADAIISESELRDDIRNNIVIRSATVNGLLNLAVKKEVDAAIIWKDMMAWPESKDLVAIEIPHDINQIKEVHVVVLSVSENVNNAQLFAEFMATEGRAIFEKNGFVER